MSAYIIFQEPGCEAIRLKDGYVLDVFLECDDVTVTQMPATSEMRNKIRETTTDVKDMQLVSASGEHVAFGDEGYPMVPDVEYRMILDDEDVLTIVAHVEEPLGDDEIIMLHCCASW